MTVSTSSLTRRFGAAAAVLILAGTLGACSQKSDSSESAGSSGSKDGDGSKSSTSAAATTYDDWMAQFNSCLVDAGVTPLEPEADGSVTVTTNDADTEKLVAASKACSDKLGPQPANDAPGKAPATEADILKSVECLRQRGYDVADPKDGALGLPQGIAEEDMAACFAR